MTPRRPRVLVFDIDDTLYLERDYVLSGFAAVDEWARLNLQAEGFGAACRRMFDQGARGKIFDAALDALGLPARPATIAAMVDCYHRHPPRIALAPDVEELRRRLPGGCRCGALSDGPLAVQQSKAEALGLRAWIEHVVLTDAWGRAAWKPHVKGFLEIERFFKAGGAECLYVADNPAKDFFAPAGLGWGAVRIRRPDGLHAAQETPAGLKLLGEISALTELAPLLGWAG